MEFKQIWLNLPVKNVARSRKFYEAIGFAINSQYGNSDSSASFFVGEHKLVLMLFHEDQFKDFVCDSQLNFQNEVLFSLSAASPAEVNALVPVVEAAGGRIFADAKAHQGWMYGMGFTDPDGHKWNLLFMDFEKLNQASV